MGYISMSVYRDIKVKQELQHISVALQLQNFSKSFSGFTVSYIYVQYLSALVVFSVF